jgi:hypothetical protein
MGYKLITDGKNNYSVLDSNNELIGTTMESMITNQKLSLKNCETIKNGYNLFKLSMDFANNHEKETDMAYEFGRDMYSFGEGFKKAIEILKNIPNTPDPKLIDSMCMRYRHDFGIINDEAEKHYYRVTMTQLWEEVVGLGFYNGPTEWDVEVEMEPYYDGEFIEDGKTHVIEPKFKPVLDEDGCLILKRI